MPFSLETQEEQEVTLAFAIQQLANAVALGSAYGLIALGYTIVFGVLRLFNLAHGDMCMLVAFLATWGVLEWGLPSAVSFVLAGVMTVVAGVILERVAYRPLRDARIAQLTSTMAVSLLLKSVIIVFFSARTKPFPIPKALQTVFQVGGATIPAVTAVIAVVSAILLPTLAYLVNRTKMGRAMRAVSTDIETTELMGIDTDRAISSAFALAMCCAVAGGFMWASKYPAVHPYSGDIPGMKAFVAAVVGGIGSLPGALLGGFLLGLGEIALVALRPDLSNWRDVLVYGVLILFLLFRPGGLFNVPVREEKV